LIISEENPKNHTTIVKGKGNEECPRRKGMARGQKEESEEEEKTQGKRVPRNDINCNTPSKKEKA
jgi:hypothetical protein